MNTHQSLAEFLQIEDSDELLSLRCPATGLPIWPQVRIAYLRAIQSDLVYGVQLTGKSQSRIPARRALTTLARSTLHNALHARRAAGRFPICMFGDGVGNRMVDGKWFNRLAGDFVAERPHQTLVVEDHFEWQWQFPRHHANVLMHAPLQAANRIAGRWKVGVRERDLSRRLIKLVNDRAAHYLRWSPGAARENALIEMAAQKTAALAGQTAAYSRLLDRIDPKVLIVNAACYGPAAALMAVAKGRGIVTAEFQHGVISRGHDAYNFAPTILASESYRQTLPDYLLTYGSWWGGQVNAPVEKVAIGSPQRASALSKDLVKDKTDLLVLSDGLETERYLELMRSISSEAVRAGLKPVLRPHPLERTKLAALPEAMKQGFEIDTNSNIYSSFNTARMVLGEASTGLFEASGIADQICMWTTPRTQFVFPEVPFQTFSTADELGELLRAGTAGNCSAGAGEMWAEDWAQNYENFLAAHGVAA